MGWYWMVWTIGSSNIFCQRNGQHVVIADKLGLQQTATGAPLKPCSVRKNMLATDAKVCLLSTSFNKQAISSSQIKIQTNNQLMLSVGGLEHGFYFSIYFGNVIIPTDELIFFRGVGIPPTTTLPAYCRPSRNFTDAIRAPLLGFKRIRMERMEIYAIW